MIAAPAAEAHVSIGIGIGGPAYGPPTSYYPYCDRYSRWYNLYRCDAAAYYDGYYDDQVYFGGVWYDGPIPYRYVGGAPEFYFGGNWHSNVHYHSGGFHGGRGHHH